LELAPVERWHFWVPSSDSDGRTIGKRPREPVGLRQDLRCSDGNILTPQPWGDDDREDLDDSAAGDFVREEAPAHAVVGGSNASQSIQPEGRTLLRGRASGNPWPRPRTPGLSRHAAHSE